MAYNNFAKECMNYIINYIIYIINYIIYTLVCLVFLTLGCCGRRLDRLKNIRLVMHTINKLPLSECDSS